MPKVVIIGNSAAGFNACDTLVKSSAQNEITIISEEAVPAYRRDLLLDYLSGNTKESALFLCNEDFYKNNNINFLNNSEAVRLDTKKQRVILKDNRKIDYDYLLIASGRKVKMPDVPGIKKEGVFSVYNLEDTRQIMQRLIIAPTVCIVGSDGLALRLAEIISAKDREVKIISKEGCASFSQTEKMELIDNTGPTELIGEAEVKAVKLGNGKIIGASLVLFTGNYIPSVDFLGESEINVSNGYIAVDDSLRTNLENVFAAGSVCCNVNIQAKDKTWEESAREGVFVAENIVKSTQKGKTPCRSC